MLTSWRQRVVIMARGHYFFSPIMNIQFRTICTYYYVGYRPIGLYRPNAKGTIYIGLQLIVNSHACSKEASLQFLCLLSYKELICNVFRDRVGYRPTFQGYPPTPIRGVNTPQLQLWTKVCGHPSKITIFMKTHPNQGELLSEVRYSCWHV